MTILLKLLTLMLCGYSLSNGTPNPTELDYSTPREMLRHALLRQSPASVSRPEKSSFQKRPYGGQPEYPDPINLPTDKQSYRSLLNALNHGSLKDISTYSTFPEIDSRGFHENAFAEGFSQFSPWKRSKRKSPESSDASDANDDDNEVNESEKVNIREKRTPYGIDARGFHENIFGDFGGFSPVKKSTAVHWSPQHQKRQTSDLYDVYLPQHFFPGKRDSKRNSYGQYDEDYLNTYIPYNTFTQFGKRLSGDDYWNTYTPYNTFDQLGKRSPKEITKLSGHDQYTDDYLNSYIPYNTFSQFKRYLKDGDEYSPNKRMITSPNPYDYFEKRLVTDNNPYEVFRKLYYQPEHYIVKRSTDEEMKMSDEDMLDTNTADWELPEGRNGGGETVTDEEEKSGGGEGVRDEEEKSGDGEELRDEEKTGGEKGVGEEDSSTVETLVRKKRSTNTDSKVDDKSRKEEKRRPEMDSSGFYGDTFSSGFGDFSTMKKKETNKGQDTGKSKRKPEMDSSGFYGDTFNNGFGDFNTMKRKADKTPNKRRPEMDSSGFYGDTFTNGFGNFYTMKRALAKRRPEMDSSGFYGDTFNSGFGDFYTMKRALDKRRPEMDSSGFYGDTFNNGFGDFYTMKRASVKRRPEMDSSGFHGDTFSGGFGDFYTMKRDGKEHKTKWSQIENLLGRLEHKRKPEMDASGFYGDTFNGGFGNFYTMKKDIKMPGHGVAEPLIAANKHNKRSTDSTGNTGGASVGPMPVGAAHNFRKYKTAPVLSDKHLSIRNSNSVEENLSDKKERGASRTKRHVILENGSSLDGADSHGDAFIHHFGGFHPVKRSEMNARGFNDDIFTNGFGSIFETMR